ncbi:hypothetical protein TBR22_A16130 [Luteitalea sp. TBR-22]|uniref:DUF6064 family protein n=1 Tax=Luteitalea sp. TBR-22 TaxID=2802971 RepID=UPI001AF0B009|nr:DUF6064 family protein [Luteitalea sp. TBR-22]BCS32399.1 hypothetical protein TBR22_A16130 [Luteitalea sp. TBR-22]
MQLPFSRDAFLDVFGAYNSRLWLAAALLWVATAVAHWVWLRGGVSRRVLLIVLAVHWAWSGIAYHWLFFRSINPAATIFAALFVLQAVLFVWLAVAARGRATVPTGVRCTVGAALVVYGLLYPFIGFVVGLDYPRLPLFAVPCPTTLVTAGFLVAAVKVPRFVAVVPILWAAVGSSAAFTLGMTADLALVIAGALLTFDLVVPTALGRRAAA